jgi:hypothetical protein
VDEGAARDRSSSNPEGSSWSWRKKKSDKEQKKKEKELKEKEKEEAKLKKQREKEQKEREKEQKEREKKAKKEAKSLSKVTGKKSMELQLPAPHRPSIEGNIYDEPGEIGALASARSPPEGLYAEADLTTRATAPPAEYATPERPKKDSWKTHARPESQDIQQENYNSIKLAAMNQPDSPTIPPPLPQFGACPVSADAEDDTYNRLDFDHRVGGGGESSVYGMASAIPTLRADPVYPPEGDYEDTESMNLEPAKSSLPPREGGDGYEEASPQLQQRPLLRVNMLDEGEYADVS